MLSILPASQGGVGFRSLEAIRFGLHPSPRQNGGAKRPDLSTVAMAAGRLLRANRVSFSLCILVASTRSALLCGNATL